MNQTGKLQSTMIGTNVKSARVNTFHKCYSQNHSSCLADNFLPISKEMDVFNHS